MKWVSRLLRSHSSRLQLSKTGFCPPPFSSNQLLTLLSSCTCALSLTKIHAQLVLHGLSTVLPVQTKLFSTYASLQNTNHARLVFDEIPNPDLYSWKVMLRGYILNQCYAEAIGLYRQMRLSLQVQDNFVFSYVLKACIKLFDLDEGMKVHCDLIKVGNPDNFVLNILIDMYAKCGYLESCGRLFAETHERNVVCWTSVMSGYIQNGCPEVGLKLFNKMREARVEPSEHTVGSLLRACSMLEWLHQGKWIHGYLLKIGMATDSTFMGTALLDMYVKCGEFSYARSIFDEIRVVDLVSWTAMIVGYTQKGCPIEALRLLTDKKWAGIVPNSVTVASALSASVKLGNLNLGRSIHVLVVKLGLEKYAVIRNALVDMYAKCGAISDANHVFERILQKDVITWNAMISGYSQNDCGYEALSLFKQMRLDGCLPDATTVVSALSACVCLPDLDIGCSFHAYALKSGFLCNIYVSTALLNLYNKCGDLISARKVFDEMSARNTVTWCAMMGGYGMQGDPTSSLNLFHEMLKEDLKPNDVTFTSLLSACSHTGMVDEGQKYFESMLREYNVVPSMKHYACMVDMLARAGKLEEAVKFIEGMPIQADASVWGALLHGCRFHSRLEIGEVAVRKMMELKPETPDYYVLMSNLYAMDGRWDDAVKIRELMKERGLIKSPGWSFTGMDSGFHDHASLDHVFNTPGDQSGNLRLSAGQL